MGAFTKFVQSLFGRFTGPEDYARNLMTYLLPYTAGTAADMAVTVGEFVGERYVVTDVTPVAEYVWDGTAWTIAAPDPALAARVAVVEGDLAGFTGDVATVQSTANGAASAAAAAQLAADAAASDAATAQATATSVLSIVNDIVSDSVLTPSEKAPLILEKGRIDSEFYGIETSGAVFNSYVERIAYTNAKVALDEYLATLNTPVAWNNTTGNTTVVAAVFRQKFLDYYNTRQALLDKNTDTARANAAAAQSTADGAVVDAAAAVAAAADAVTDASEALAAITDMVSDNILSPVEKPAVIKEKAQIDGEYSGIAAAGATFGNTALRTSYIALKDELDTYLATLTTPVAWNVTTGNTTIVGTTFRERFVNYYTIRQALLNANADVARANAATAQSSANTAITLAASRTTVFYQTSAPTNPQGGYSLQTGDLWYNTTADADGRISYRPSRWTGAAWTAVAAPAKLVLGELAVGAVAADNIAANALATADYTEDANAIPTAGVKMMSSNGATAWSGATTYVIGDLVTSSNVVYRCILGHTNQAPPNVTYWAKHAPLRVGPAGMQLGAYLIDELKSVALSAIGRTDANASLVWYRGNSLYYPPGGVTGGVPVLIDPAWIRSTTYAVGDRVCAGATAYPVTLKRDGTAAAATGVYVCTQAGASASTGNGPTGTGTGITDNAAVWDYIGTIDSQERVSLYTYRSSQSVGGDCLYFLRIGVQPKTNKDNLDGLRYALVMLYSSLKAAIDTDDCYVPLPDRLYRTPETAESTNNSYAVSLVISGFTAVYYNAVPYPFNGYARVRLINVNGASRDRDFNFSARTTSGNGTPGEWTLGGSSGGGGGGAGGGGGCVAPETPVFIAPGITKPIGEFRAGDIVWTRPEGGGELGFYRVESVEHTANLRCRVSFTDGRSFICSINHRVNVRGIWRRADSLQKGEEMQGDPNGYIASVEYLGEGRVVKMPIIGARTYLAGDGAWHHNPIK